MRKTLEIKWDDEETYTSLEELAEALPENSPRFILLSNPVTLKSGRLAAPYVLLYYMPDNANGELRMVYAGAKELMRNTAEVSKVLDVSDEDELLQVAETLREG
ncbi:hypothetical protein ABW21_db0203364 [Orbilia brochopaga]|nr:hypothetical protein ABW21_db0203364 [Drechslerella brochopaga]